MTRFLAPLLAFVAAFAPLVAHATDTVYVVCTGLAGCGGTGELFTHALTAILSILVTISAGMSMIFMVWGGFQMLLTFGDDAKGVAGKNTIKNALIGLAITMLSGSAVAFFASESFGGPSGDPFIGAMEAAVRIMITLFNVMFALALIYAGFEMAISRGKSEGFAAGTTIIQWAITGAIVVNLARAIVDAFIGLSF